MTKELIVSNLYGIRGEITHRTDSNIDRGRPDMPSVAGIDVLELADGQVAK